MHEAAPGRRPLPGGWRHFPEPTVAPTRFALRTAEQLDLWTENLKKTGFKFDESDSILYWNILSAVYTITEFEKLNVRATIAYEMSGASKKTGQRKFDDLKKAGLILTSENPYNNKEKFVTVLPQAADAVLETFDEWAIHYEKVTNDYKMFRKKQGKDLRLPSNAS